MCTVCGCGNQTVEGKRASEGLHAHDHSHQHGDHDHHHHDDGGFRQTEGLVDASGGLAGLHVPGLSQERIVRIEQDILSKNNSYARENRARFARSGTFALNFVSSPGSGKTTRTEKQRSPGPLIRRHNNMKRGSSKDRPPKLAIAIGLVFCGILLLGVLSFLLLMNSIADTCGGEERIHWRGSLLFIIFATTVRFTANELPGSI